MHPKIQILPNRLKKEEKVAVTSSLIPILWRVFIDLM